MTETIKSGGGNVLTKKTLPAVISDLGRLSLHSWDGHTSAEDVSVTTFQQIKLGLNKFYVSVSPTAKTRCIDDRDDPDYDERNLGSQVPGGAPGAAVAWRLGVDEDDLTRGSFLQDGETMINRFLRLGLTPGGHRDQNQNENHAGCGAIDGMDHIVDTMINPKRVDDHKRLVKGLFGDGFNRENYLRTIGAGVVLRGQGEDYFRDRQRVLDYLEEKAPGSIATLDGVPHSAAAVVVNFVPDTTLATNRFKQEFGVAAFGYDIWRSKQIAEMLLPLPNEKAKRERFVMARVMYTVATIMSMVDGTQHLYLRLPSASNE